MNSSELRDQFRLEVGDTAEPHLWEDPEVFRYIDDAQKTFCRRTGGLGDATSLGATRVGFDAGDTFVDTHRSILKIRDAYLPDGTHVTVLNYEDLAERGLRLDGRTDAQVKVLIIGMQPHKARLYPAPTQSGTINLLIDRLPLKAITGEDQNFEVDEQHHLHLLHWVKHLAYGKQDSETYDKRKSQEYETKFYAYCGEAKVEKDRAKHKTRVVSYGGI